MQQQIKNSSYFDKKNSLRHKNFNWIFCYDDDCQIHFNEKKIVLIFQKKKKQKKNECAHKNWKIC